MTIFRLLPFTNDREEPGLEMDFGEYKIRNWQESDQVSLVKYADNPRIWINVDDIFPHPYTTRDARYWIRETEYSKTDFAIATDKEAIGGIGIRIQPNIYRRSAELGYWLGEPFWGKGIVTMAVKTMLQYAFSSFDLVRIYALVFDWNPASRRVLEKNGFKCEARLEKHVTKDGKTIDAFLYAMIKNQNQA